MKPLLEVKNLGLTLNGQAILRDISFSVEKGEFIGIIGPNGAGKSSLLKCLGRLEDRGSGSVSIDGRDLGGFSAREIARRIAWVHQGSFDDLPFTVREFALLSRYPWKESFAGETGEDRKILSRVFSLTGLDDLADRPLGLLSGGERQKALLAAALAQTTDILFLDEPTSYLDYRHQVETLALVERVNREEGTTIFFITHDANLSLRCARRILALKGGRLFWDGPREDFLSGDLPGKLFDTPFHYFSQTGGGIPYMVPEGLLK